MLATHTASGALLIERRTERDDELADRMAEIRIAVTDAGGAVGLLPGCDRTDAEQLTAELHYGRSHDDGDASRVCARKAMAWTR